MRRQSRIAGAARKLRRELLKSLSRGLRIPPVGARFEGLQLEIPLVYGLGADHLSRSEAPWTYHLLARLLERRPGTLVDIGANVGLYLIWLKSIDADRGYLGFEPNPACYFYLQELVRCNRFSDARVLPLALSDRRALQTFFARRLGDKMGSLLAHHRVEADKPYSFTVLTERADAVFADLDLTAISAIKIDVEGAELEVLSGLAATLSRYRPLVICEVLTPDPGRPEYDAAIDRIEKLLSLLRDIDYQLMSLAADNELSTVSSPADLTKDSRPDRILVPGSERESILELWRSTQATSPAGTLPG
jgi:FkbM family methyltransferase